LQARSYAQDTRLDRFGPAGPGNDPPLSVDGGRAPDRRRVSLRWLTGTILTGLFGATLMGGAVYAALDGEYTFARAPLAATGSRDVVAASETQTNGTRKTDRILTQTDTFASHQVIRVSTVTKVGERDIIKVKPFARVMANLSLVAGERASDVPDYNPIKIFAEANPEPAAAEALPEDEEGEVTVASTDLAGLTIDPDAGLALPPEQVEGLVREQASFEANAVSITVPPQLLNLGLASDETSPAASLAYAVDAAGGALEVSIVPENVTEVGKTASTASVDSREQTIVVQDKETLAVILGRLGATQAETDAIAKALGDKADLNEGQRLRVLAEPVPEEGGRGRPVRVSIYNADQHLGTIALSDNGDYVAVADPDATETANADGDESDDEGGIRLYNSIYETALRQQVPKDLIEELLRIYAYDVDLSRRTRAGDNFELFYEQDEAGNPVGDILYTALSIDGELKRYYRFVSPDDGQIDYYDEQGRSARKFLMRKPINGGEMRSTFGLRRHPILGYYKMHTGVDWAGVPVGTPILATGNGTITKAAWTNGYGRHIEIQHANGYETTYSHMSAFAKGMKPGVKVKLGQVIGYLGSSGLSTGPHIHYEVKINDNFVDPMRIKLPQGRELNGDMLSSFRQERDRIDSMMSKAPVAQATTPPPTPRG
jgi:murein DD-endopeptidase MepM/ murein hydrolase activator NlpD